MYKKIYLFILLVFFTLNLTAQQTKQGHPFSDKEKISLKLDKNNSYRYQTYASNKTFNMDSIKYWVGTGSKRAAIGVQWKNADNTNTPVMVWGYRWDKEEDGTGEKMICAIARQDSRFFILVTGGTAYGMAIGGIGYDVNEDGNIGITKKGKTIIPENGIIETKEDYDFDEWKSIDTEDYWYSGWYKGFLTYMVREKHSDVFQSSSVGVTGRKLTDGCWDVWVANPGFSMITDESINSKFVASLPKTTTPKDYKYTNGVFFVNEDWFGHNNSTVNFLDKKNGWHYRIFQVANPGHELGCTSQFGTVYGGNMFIVSKQEKDKSANIVGSRLAVADAVTMKVKAEIQKISENKNNTDGRAFVGINDSTGYISSSSGIYIFDIKNMKMKDTITYNSETFAGERYNEETGNMIRVGNRVFAIMRNKGILIINPLNHTLEQVIKGNYGSVVLGKDGAVWVSTDEMNNRGKTLIKLNPYSLKKEEISLPESASIPCSWYAWTADGFCASNQTTSLYWHEGGWAAKKIFRYKIGDIASVDKPIFNADNDMPGWKIYSAGMRVDPVTDEIYISMFKEFGSKDYKVIKLDSDGKLLEEYPMDNHYWFPAMPVFPDNFEPVIDDSFSDMLLKKDTVLYLGDKVTDKDNFDAAIIKTFTLDNSNIVDVDIINDSLKIVPKGVNGTVKLILIANSNGKIAKKTINVQIDIPLDLNQSELLDDIKIYPNPASDYLSIDTSGTVSIVSANGLKVYENANYIEGTIINISHLSEGTYFVKVGYRVLKLIKK